MVSALSPLCHLTKLWAACMERRPSLRVRLVAIAVVLISTPLHTSESDCYRIVSLPLPDGLKLEVGGLARLPHGRLAAAVRKGEVWIVEDAYVEPPKAPKFRRFASGLHEPLGLTYRDGFLYLAQRSEVTRLADHDGDGIADEYLTVGKGWGVSGNYHEYAYGPKFDPQGNLWIMLNSNFGEKGPWPEQRWRGWSIVLRPDGSWEPVAAGFRSPCGLGFNLAGDLFAVDSQGGWVATCPLFHIEKGAFYGYVPALADAKRPESPVKHPGKIPTGLTVPEAARVIPGFKLPAVWFPYRKMGQASTDVLCDTTEGKFGPFAGQLFVGDFTLALISRVALERVNGVYQGACFPFRRGFGSAVFRMEWGADGSMFVGETNRGWNSLGTRSYGLERLVWTGKVPFEVKTMVVQPDGFFLTFTKPVHRAGAAVTDAYRMKSYTYKYHQTYGSPEVDTRELRIDSATVSSDAFGVRLVVDELREGYVHELHLPGVRAVSGELLLHPQAYYTLNTLPR